MTNQQRVKAAAHYTAWRSVQPGGPSVTGLGGAKLALEPVEFARKGEVRQFSRDAGPAAATISELVDAAMLVSSDAAAVADRGPRARFPRGSFVRLSGEFPTSVGLWNRYQGDIRSRAGRDGLPWRRSEAGLGNTMVDLCFPAMESRMTGVQPPGDGMATVVRDLYTGGW